MPQSTIRSVVWRSFETTVKEIAMAYPKGRMAEAYTMINGSEVIVGVYIIIAA